LSWLVQMQMPVEHRGALQSQQTTRMVQLPTILFFDQQPPLVGQSAV
jgi:hypothetical protein